MLHASWTEWKNEFALEVYCRTAKLAVSGLWGSYGPQRLVVYRMRPELGPPDVEEHTYGGRGPHVGGGVAELPESRPRRRTGPAPRRLPLRRLRARAGRGRLPADGLRVSVERFFQAVRPAPDGAAQVSFATSYLPAESALNWSEELEGLHAEDHFIDALTRRAVVDALRRGQPESGAVIVDVGCSSGVLLGDLAAAEPDWALVGVDSLLPALERANDAVPSASLFHASAAELPFGDATVDALVAVNVLEHIADDTQALREFRRVLRPGGRAVLVVPWNRRLYDAYDAFLQHERRYARGDLRRRAREAELDPLETRYVGTVVYPGFWAVKTYGRLRHGRGDDKTGRAVVSSRIGATRSSRVAIAGSRLEERLGGLGVHFPFGIRELGVFRRR